jgi:hypothetical protein
MAADGFLLALEELDRSSSSFLEQLSELLDSEGFEELESSKRDLVPILDYLDHVFSSHRSQL